MKPFYYAAFFTAALVLPSALCTNSWSDPSKDQYHIQTDEGPERYFRYQTLSGQYRKEKRLEDGTVVGSYGWVDADGVFRMREYIADSAGYRILKTKNVYVGNSRSINEALSIAKKAPVEAGVLAGGAAQTRYSYNVPVRKSSYGAVHTPNVEVSFNSVPSSTIEPPISSTSAYLPPSTTPVPTTVTEYLPPSPTPVPTTYLPSSTPAPVYIPSTYLPSTTPAPDTHAYYRPTAKPDYYSYITSATSPPPLPSNAIYSSDPQYEHYTNPYIFQNGPTYPIDKFGHSYNGLGNGYDRQFPLYDGVSVTNDGFRYYIPKQYHEEQHHSDNRKSGSFGYIDPFGIRRVIYYNAGPDGFKHRKNNRYVGLDATPYDPRPY